MVTGMVIGLCLTVAGGITQCNEAEAAFAIPRPSDSDRLHWQIRGVTVHSPPVVQFSVDNENGDPVLLTQDDVTAGALRFGIAKLVPGENGDADHWQSYINTVEQATPGVGPGGAAVLASATQATVEARGDAGTLTRNADGSYSYRFKTDITDPNQTMGVVYQPSLTHRVAIQVELEGRHGVTFVTNPYFDFVPDGTPVATEKRVVHKDACNGCHHELALHGGGRVETEYCVVCHNPGTTDANSGNVLDFSRMVHKIHMGEELAEPYVIWGYRDSEHDYSSVVYPRDHRGCSQCHSGDREATPEGDNWKLRPTREACGACHETVDFTNHPHTGEVQADNSRCAQCHVPYSGTLHQAIENAHTNPLDAVAARFRYHILAVNYDPGSRGVTVDFSVTDPTNDDQPYDIQSHPAFTAGGGASRMAVLIGWNSADFSNEGSGNVAGQPLSVDPLFGNATDIGGNVFRVTATLPPQAGGTGSVGIEGHPAVDGARIPVANVVEYFAISGPLQPRRQVVSIDKCNVCHGNLSLHGNNRQGTVEICVICHNPDATDIEVRPATLDDDGDGVFDDFTAVGVDGLREESIHFKHMIHAIHAGAADGHGFRENGLVVYGFRRSVNDYSHVRYPGILSNCNACHLEDSYKVNATAGALATTTETASPFLAGNQHAVEQALEDPADDLNTSPETAGCASCHDGEAAREHMESVGRGAFGLTQAVIGDLVWEDCGGCHGPHEFKDVAGVHRLR